MQGDMASLKDRSDFHSKGLAAIAALVDPYPGALPLQLGAVADHAAARANRPFRP